MKKIVLTNDEKVLLKTLCSVSGGGTDLMIFLKDNFFDDKFIAVDDKNKEVIFFYNILSNCNKEIKKLSHLIKVIQFLDENDFILLNPYNRAPSNIPSIIWIKATRPYSLTSNNDIQIANNIIMSKGIVTENGVRIMDGRRLGKSYYQDIQSWYAYVSINQSFEDYIDNDFKTTEEIKTRNERVGGFVMSVVNGIKKILGL